MSSAAEEPLLITFKTEADVVSVPQPSNPPATPVAAAAAAPTAAQRKMSWDDKILKAFQYMVVTASICSSLLVTHFLLVAIPVIAFGVVFVCAWDTFVKHSLESFPNFQAILPMFWHHLRVELLGGATLCITVGALLGGGAGLYVLIRSGFAVFTATPEERRKRIASVTSSMKTTAKSRFYYICMAWNIIYFGTYSMHFGIILIKWWNEGKSIDAVTENANHSAAVAFSGSVAYVLTLWLRGKLKAPQPVELTGNDELSVTSDQVTEAQAEPVDASTKV